MVLSSLEEIRTFVYQICVLLTRSPIEGRHLFYIVERKVLLPRQKELNKYLHKNGKKPDSSSDFQGSAKNPFRKTENLRHGVQEDSLSVELLEIYQHIFKTVLKYAPRFLTPIGPSERLILDSTLDVSGRLQNFENYFRRLSPKDQLVLILKNQFHWSGEAISRCLQIPSGTLATQEWMAYRNLENWIWEGRV